MRKPEKGSLLSIAGLVVKRRGLAINDPPSMGCNPKTELVVDKIYKQIFPVESLVREHLDRHEAAGGLSNQILCLIGSLAICYARASMHNLRHHQKYPLTLSVPSVVSYHLGDKTLKNKTVLVKKKE